MFRNKTFYPTPEYLVSRMISKINEELHPDNILEPSAGKGDILEALNHHEHRRINLYAIEKSPDLRATLMGKNYKVIDSDFLTFAGPDKFDLIIANPPFDNGDKHLLKAIDILYSGQIIFLLNAETLKNPYTNTRKVLVRKLEELDADIEYIEGAFKDAERPTGVEVALISIIIERKVEDDLFTGCDDTAETPEHTLEETYEVSTKKKIPEVVAEYNQVVKIGTETIVNYYRNYKKVGKYIGLNDKAGAYSHGTLTTIMQEQLNKLLTSVREDFWKRTLDLPEVKNRMTKKKRDEFYTTINKQSNMDFTENNIRTFVLNLIKTYEQTLTEAVLEVFDLFTVRHSWDENNKREKNIHYFNGWKTNNAFKVGKKVIIPIYASYGNPFLGYSGQWKLDYAAERKLADIDVVMNYFNGLSVYDSISNALERNFANGISSSIRSTYFTITAYKKGTIHLTFNDEGTLRRFNVAACKGKGWLPENYGASVYDELPTEEKDVVSSFEGKQSYNKYLNQPLFAASMTRLQITA